VYVSANSEEAIRAALAWSKEAHLSMVLVGGADAWKVTKELKEQGVPVVYSAPTTSCPGTNGTYGSLDPYDASLSAPALMARDGVRFCLQGGNSSGIMTLPWSAGMLVAYGLAHEDAVRSLTLSSAEILGVAHDLGSLDPGKLANIAVFDGDPLEITTQCERVWIAGKPQTLRSKFTDLYRKYERRLAE
jgi:imidazolonepropionase-like amidohydrolase